MAPKQAAGKLARGKVPVQRPARRAAPPKSKNTVLTPDAAKGTLMAKAKTGGKTTISSPGKSPVTFTKGGLHKSLGVPPSKPIPAGKMADALAGKAGPLAKKQANLARGMLAAGRKTATKNKKG